MFLDRWSLQPGEWIDICLYRPDWRTGLFYNAFAYVSANNVDQLILNYLRSVLGIFEAYSRWWCNTSLVSAQYSTSSRKFPSFAIMGSSLLSQTVPWLQCLWKVNPCFPHSNTILKRDSTLKLFSICCWRSVPRCDKGVKRGSTTQCTEIIGC